MRILYVGHDKKDTNEFCSGSLVCMSLVEQLPTVNKIVVQDCDILRKSKQIPDWLDGTPILIDDTDQIPRRGTQAVRYLQELLATSAEDDDPEPTKPTPHARASSNHGPTNRNPVESTLGRGTSDEPDMFGVALGSNPSVQRPKPKQDINDDDDEGDGDNDSPFESQLSSMGNASIKADKVTEQDLQKYMEERNASKASLGTNGPQQPAR